MADDSGDIFQQYRDADTSTAAVPTMTVTARQPPASSTAKPADTAKPPAGGDIFEQYRAADTAAKATQPPPPATTATGVGGGPAESAADTFKRWLGFGGPPAQSSPLADVITSPEAQAADRPAGVAPSSLAAPPSLKDMRAAIQRGDINALTYLNQNRPAPPSDSIWSRLGYTAKEQALEAAAVGTHLAAGAAQIPLNALIAAQQGASGNVMIDPTTGHMSASPEALQTSSLLANPLRFSGPTPLAGAGPATIDLTKNQPLNRPVTLGEITDAINRASQPPTPATAASGATPPPQGTTGLAGLGGAGQAMSANLGDMLWTKLQAGDTTELGRPSQILVDAKAAADQGLIKNRADFDAWTQQWAQSRRQVQAQPAGAAPTPAGAQATPPSAAAVTPQETAQARTVADKQWLNSTVQPGIQDTQTGNIPGITPSLVEQEQTVQRARELKALKNLNPALSQNEREILDANNNVRQNYYADTVGSEVTRAADLKAANDKIETDLGKVWANKGEADPANVNAQIRSELSGSAGELPPLKSAMNQVSDSLANAGTDPQAMYRTHRLINYLQSKQGQLANPGYGSADVQAALTRVKGTLATTIDDAAPGFSNAMSDYAAARGPIDAAKALQDRENALYDSQGRMQFLPVHKLMRDIIEAQKWDAPNDPLAGVSEEQMARLKTLHDNLKRVASAKDLAIAAGSDTAMNAMDIAKEYAKGLGGLGVQGAANLALGPGLGSMAVRGVRAALDPLLSARATRRQMQRGMEILRPNPLQPPSTGNPLTPP